MLPAFLKPFFWSYKFEELDQERDKALVIKTILDVGDKATWDWVVSVYPASELRRVVTASTASSWNRGSLALWQNVLGVKTLASPFATSEGQSVWPY